MQNTFSIIIPTYNRRKELLRALRSLRSQNYPKDKFEVIVVDDGSTDDTLVRLEQWCKHTKLNIIIHTVTPNQGRINARNVGMGLATKDWICWLDSDDEYTSIYLDTFNNAINQFPQHQVFNCGGIQLDAPNFQHRLWPAFVPELRGDGGGAVPFKSGGVSSGWFVFKRELFSEVGLLPLAPSPYGNSESFPAKVQEKWPEIKALYGQNPQGEWLPFGNPWGDDWVYFYLLNRTHISKPINLPLYIQHKRP